MPTLSDISVVMPFWNRQEDLDFSLMMHRQLYENRPEIVVVADGCEVEAQGHTVVKLPAKDFPLNPCVPINRGVEASTRSVIVLTNPEVVHIGPVLSQMLAALNSEDDYVMATCIDDTTGEQLAGASVDYSSHGRLPVPEGAHFHFCAMFYRSLWDRAGGFDEDYRHVQGCDDNDWLWRLERVSANFKLLPSTVLHRRSNTRWNLPHGCDLFLSKWPQCASARRTG